jgi:hypothetical protein
MPVGNGEDVVIVNADRICSEKLFCTVTAGVLPSATRTAKFEVPVPVGVPLRVPLGARFNPAGNDPD